MSWNLQNKLDSLGDNKTNIIKKIIQNGLDLIFPIQCLGCDKDGSYICETCMDNCIDTRIERYCPVCLSKSVVGGTHPKCLSPHSIDGIFSAGNFYNKILQDAIKKLKYRNVKLLSYELAKFVTREFLNNFRDLLVKNEFVLTFVPLYPTKQKQRGYNQSELLAQYMGKFLNLEVSNTLKRIKDTKDQTKLNKLDRFLNIDKAFVVDGDIRDKSYLIVDDVTTTGATLMECAKVLKRNGAKIVWGITIAKESKSAKV